MTDILDCKARTQEAPSPTVPMQVRVPGAACDMQQASSSHVLCLSCVDSMAWDYKPTATWFLDTRLHLLWCCRNTSTARLRPTSQYVAPVKMHALFAACMPHAAASCDSACDSVRQICGKDASRDRTSCGAPSYEKLCVYEGVLTYCCAQCRQAVRLLAWG
jgi:hypothetical protein